MRYIPVLIIALVAFACAQRPDDTNADQAYSSWVAQHSPDEDEDTDEPGEFDGDIDDSYEIEKDIDDYDPPNDPDVPEEDIDLVDDDITDYDLIDDDMVDEDLIIDPMTCTDDTCDDKYSGLTWQKDSSYTGAQGNSASFCAALADFGGLTGWRLPTIDELRSLRRDCDNDAGCTDAAVCYWDVALGGPCDKPHWSSTLAGGAQYYTLNFKTGAVAAVEGSVNQYARCVTETTK